MNKDLIQALMSGRRAKSVKPADFSKGFALVRTEEGLIKLPLDASLRKQLGGFQGRQGTIKRSRKGRTSIQANGYCKYVPGELDIVSYKV